MKIEQQKIKSDIDRYYDVFLKYEKLEIINEILSERNLFYNEEAYVSNALTNNGSFEYSISNIFKEDIKKKINLIKKDYFNKNERISYNLKQINDELFQLNDLPIINSRFRNIKSELITQIKKWKYIFEKAEIERWLANFDDDNDRLTALKILDNIMYFSNSDFNLLCKQLFFRIQAINSNKEKNFFLYSFIGGLTSGSLHILRPFKEMNKLDESNFIDYKELQNHNLSNKKLILLDDFIGSGNTFINFYNEKLEKILSERQINVYYCVLTGLKKGINKIEEETHIPVICAQRFDEKDMILKGAIFNDEDKLKIKQLIQKYSYRLPKRFLYGYDNSELLVVFESNIPNNSIALLWASESWMPLKQRL